jgi:hypothetical protein
MHASSASIRCPSINLFGLARQLEQPDTPGREAFNPDTCIKPITKYYEAEISRLKERTGRDLTHWKSG